MTAVTAFGRADVSVVCPFWTGEFGDESEAGVLTVVKVSVAQGEAYARYLEARAARSAAGDYYLRDGERVEAPGRWGLGALGADAIGVEDADAPFRALMAVVNPVTGGPLRRAGGNGSAVGAIDCTFSAPKSVSAVWALASPELRKSIETAHEHAVDAAVAHAIAYVPMVRRDSRRAWRLPHIPPWPGCSRSRARMAVVPKVSNELASPVLDAGWAELREGRWDAAMAFFEGAVAVEESPEAFEGLSWAAWWRDDSEVVFDARRRAYGLYKTRGDAPGAARMATWLACDQLDFSGAVAVASGWLARAHRLLDPLEPGPEHGWLAFFEGYIAAAGGDTAHALELAAGAAEIGRRLGVTDLEMLGLALEGATLVACAQVERGMRCLDEATAAALEGDAAVPISSAWACCFLVTACSAVRDYERAFEWCDRIAEFAERCGSRYMLAFCRAEYGAVHLWRGRWADAEAMLVGSVEDFSRSRPAMVGAPLVGLAELRRRQGCGDEAALLLDRAGSSSAAQLCRARLALDQGQTRRSVEVAERLLRQVPAHYKLDRAPALELLIRGRIARGELDQARSALEALREIERLVGTAPLRACVDMAEGLVAAAGGDHDRARTLLEDAVDRFDRSGGPFEAAQARVELATSLVALGRTDVAEREAAAALNCMLELGAVVDAERARRILDASVRDGGSPLAELTRREREVLCLLAEGLTNRQIAERLVVSEHTVHRHVTNILRKLELPSRTAAAAHAVRSGLLGTPHE